MQPSDKAFRLGLIGWPLEHSLSPQLHRAALADVGLAGEYRLFPTDPLDGALLAGRVAALRSGELDGLNVTIPLKQVVIPLLDDLTPEARAIGAVNTLYRQDGRVVGDNTDAPGFLADLKVLLRGAGFARKRALLLGAGGAARAVCAALRGDGWEVVLAARRPAQALELANVFGAQVCALCAGVLGALTGIDLLVNTTPLGMFPQVEASPWPDGLPFPPTCAVYDLVYNPAETLLLRQARAGGFPARNGLGMLIEQAALAFTRWTGCEPSRSAMKNALGGFGE